MAHSTSSPNCEPLDLIGRQRQLSSSVGVAEKIADRFAKGVRRVFPFLVRQRAKVIPQAVEAHAAKTFSLPGPGYCFSLAEPDGSAWLTLVMDGRAIAMVLEGTLGGIPPELEEGEEPEIPELTAAQKAVLKGGAEALAQDLSDALRAEAGVNVELEDLRSLKSNEGIQVGDDALIFRVEFSDIPAPCHLTVLLGAEALEAAGKERQAAEAPACDPKMVDAVTQVSMEVVTELGRMKLGLGQLLALQAGETLRLGTALDDPVVVRVAGVKKFDGKPVVSRGQVAVQILGRNNA